MVNKTAFTTPTQVSSISPSHGIKEVQVTELEENMKVKSAKEMFEELGFEQPIYSETHIGYIGMYSGEECIINFYPLAKTYAVHTTYVIDKELHQAITQQLKELEEK